MHRDDDYQTGMYKRKTNFKGHTQIACKTRFSFKSLTYCTTGVLCEESFSYN